MTKRTRYFLIGMVAFLGVGLAAGLIAYFGGVPGAMAQSGVDELQYVPSDAVVVAYADVDELMRSNFRHAVKEMEPGEHTGQAEFRDATGINIETDVDYVVAALLPEDPAVVNPDKTGYILARGTFDRPRIEGFIESKGGRAEGYRDKKLYLPPEHVVAEGDVAEGETERHGRGKMALAFIENDVVAFGSLAGVKRAIDMQYGEVANVTTNDELLKMIRGVQQGNAWAVGRFDMLTRNAQFPREIADRIPPITWFSAMGHVNGGVAGRLAVEARDPQAADNLRQVVNGFMALARLQAGSGSQVEMNTMLNSIQMEPSDGNTVAISFSVPTEALELFKNRK